AAMLAQTCRTRMIGWRSIRCCQHNERYHVVCWSMMHGICHIQDFFFQAEDGIRDDRATSQQQKQAAHARSATAEPLYATLARGALLCLDSMAAPHPRPLGILRPALPQLRTARLPRCPLQAILSTRGRCGTTSGTRTSSTRSDTPKWRQIGSRTFGEADLRPWASCAAASGRRLAGDD